MQRWNSSVLLGLAVLAVPSAVPARPQAAAKRVVGIAITPSGATLRSGETIQLAAEGRDKKNKPVGNVKATWKTSKSSVATVDSDGNVSAGSLGLATISAKKGSLKDRAVIAVVDTPTDGGEYVAAGIGGMFQVMVDDEWVYWTDNGASRIRIRKTRKTGGAIFDLWSEPTRTKSGLSANLVHLQQNADTVFWSRRTVGLAESWALFSIPKAGANKPKTVLRDGIAIAPLLSTGWRVSGRKLVVTPALPERLDLPDDTVLAAYDIENGTWSTLVTGRFNFGQVHITAATDELVFVRAVNTDGETDTIRVDPTDRNNTFRTLLSSSGTDRALANPGAADAQSLYFWTRVGDEDRLLSLPADGGNSNRLAIGGIGPGLAADGTNLYWLQDEKRVVRLSKGGGQPDALRTNIFALGTSGGIAADDQFLYLPVQDSDDSWSIIRIAK